MLPQVILKSGRDKSVRNRHPRLFAGAIKDIVGKPKEGDVVDVLDNKNEWLARGVINQQAQIAVRLVSFDEREIVDDGFWQARVQSAVARRNNDPNLRVTNARRLIFGESDGLPGVVADDFGGHIVLQISTMAAFKNKATLVAALIDATRCATLIEKSDEERARYENVKESVGALHGLIPTQPVEIVENDVRFFVDLSSGQKTGFYLDQRENRLRVARYCGGGRMLNAFSFTGGFGVYAAAHGAHSVVNLDSSAEALRVAELNFGLNAQAQPFAAAFVCSDAFKELRESRKTGEQYDVVVLDPPKFAHNLSQVDRAARAYKDLNRVGMGLVKAGGVLATFSCSGVVSAELFQKIIFSAAVEANRDAHIVEKLSQASDHPISVTFPESEYLKGFILRVG